MVRFYAPFIADHGGHPASNRKHVTMVTAHRANELELELIQTQMAQKPVLRAELYAHAMRASQNRKKEVRREKEV